MIASGDMLEGCQELHFSSYIRDVNYSCGSCGYQLNLNSCNRNTSAIDTRYEKSIKRGLISFFSVDESRFRIVEQLRWVPFFNSKRSWGLFQRRTKLLCRKCGNHIGYACSLPFESWDGISDSRVYDIKLSALQPSFYHQDPGKNGAGCGGVIREANGNFIMAFMHRLNLGDHVIAEIWGILLGLKTTWDQGKRRVVLESDAKEVLDLINTENCQNHPDANTIAEVNSMLQREWRIELRFVLRNANRVADFLAKKALSCVTGFHPILFSTPELTAVLELDHCIPTDVG